MISMLETIYNTFKLQMKHSFARPTYRYCLLVQPIIFSIITYMMFKNSGQDNFISFVVLGTGLLNLWSSICFSSAGDIERERLMGTLRVIYCTPTDFKVIMLGKILGNTILGLIPFGISFAVVKLVFNGNLYIKDPMAFIASMLITIISFIGISLVFSAFFTLSRSSRMLMNCIEYPIFILCGILFPIEILPGWTRIMSYILSPTWAAKILRMSAEGVGSKETFYANFGTLTVLSISYFVLSYILFNIIDKRARITASLEVV
jgi:ABC-2 type transport system permease protein